MNIPNFKDILKIVLEKLSIFRNNVPLLVSVIIALVALLLFVPTQLLSSSLTKEIQEKSINIAKRIPLLKEKNVSSDKLKAAQESLDKLAGDANSIELKAIQTTQRELLNDVIFTLDPNDSTFSQTIFYDFGRRYRSAIDEFIQSHNVSLCPTKADIENEMNSAGISNILQSTATGMGRTFNSMTDEENIQGIIVDQICRKRAESAFVYIDPYAISGYEFWTDYEYTSWNEDIQNCWYSQLGYWVIEDIFDTIVAMNKGHDSLLTAPVKRLMKINFSDETSLIRVGNISANAEKYTDRPRYVFSNVTIPKETLTGRYCNEQFHVIHFKISFVINTKDFMHLVRELCSAKEHKYTDESGQTHTYKHNQITVLGTSVRSVDTRSTDHELYRYGDDESVSEIELTCEYIFNKKGYEEIMPKPVKSLFNSTN